MKSGRSLFVLLILALTSCGVETVVHNIDEREANKVIELLAENNISSNKMVSDNGRTITYSVTVPQKNRVQAIKVLNRYEMPRRADAGYLEIFKEGGLIPTASEEHAKNMAALEGEIEKQLKLIDGVLDAQVQLVMPEDNPLRSVGEVRPTTTASVTIRYLPNAGNKPIHEHQVQALVAAGVERLQPKEVVVVMTPAGPLAKHALDTGNSWRLSGSTALFNKVNDVTLRWALVSLVAMLLLLAILAVVWFIQLRTVRKRFIRLQEEIMKARKKQGTDQDGSSSRNS